MSSVTVIGAGITGPAAALSLARKGHDVSVYEIRAEDDPGSENTLGITNENVAALTALGIDCITCLPAGSLAVSGTVDHGTYVTRSDTWTSAFNIAVWGDLHRALVKAGREAGVSYHWMTGVPGDDRADLTVHAAGVSYAAHHSAFTPAGYNVVRGAFDGQVTAPSWTALHSAEKEFVLNVGQVSDRGSWMFYFHSAEVLHHTLIELSPDHVIMDLADRHLPEPYRSLVTGTSGRVQVSSVGDWQMPRLLWWQGEEYGGHGLHADAGDGIVPVRPHTTMGANLGIAEALGLASAFGSPSDHSLPAWESVTRTRRAQYITKGHELGVQFMGA